MPARDAIDAHLDSTHVARILYGSIVGLAVVVALQSHPPSAGATVALLLGTALAVGLAELYAEYVSAEIRTRRPVASHSVAEMAGEAAAVAFGASFPALFFVLAAAGVIELPAAFTLAKWTGASVICGYAFIAARMSGLGTGRSLVHAAVLGSIGFALIGLKALVH